MQHWVQQTDAGTVAQYIAEKRARAHRIGLEHVEAATKRVWSTIETIPVETAKDLQALTTSYGIAVDKMDQLGGKPNAGTRFGTRDSLLDGWSDQDRLTLERIERVIVEPASPPEG